MQHSGAVALVHEEMVHLVRQLMTGDRLDSSAPSFAQHSVLSYVRRNPRCRASQIAESFSVHRSTISRQIRTCVANGWMHTEDGPMRSGHPLTLTDAGIEILDRADRSRLTEVENRMRDWSAPDIEQFANLLYRFRATQSTLDPTAIGGDTNA